MRWRKATYKITIKIEAVGTGREEIPARHFIGLAGCGRKKFEK